MNGAERLIIEKTIAAAALDDEQAMRYACAALGPHPFRSHEAHELNRILHFCSNLAGAGRYDGSRNRDTLFDAMLAAGWPQGASVQERSGMVEMLWTPLACLTPVIREIVDALRDENDAFDRLLAVRQRFAASQAVSYALEQEHLWSESPREREAPTPIATYQARRVMRGGVA